MAGGTLVNLSEAKRLLATCTDLDQIADIANKAEAIRQYLKASGEGLEAQNRAAEIRLRAERRAGDLLAGMPKAQGRRNDLVPSRNQVGSPTLADIGITKKQSHYYQLEAAVPEDRFEQLVAEATPAGIELTSSGLRYIANQLKHERKAKASRKKRSQPESCGIITDLNELVADGRKFGCIYADPPWSYNNKATRAAVDGTAKTNNGRTRKASAYKSTMTVEDVCAEPVAELAADEAHLHLWTTNAFLFEARSVMAAWGFEYKSCFVWVKPQMGIGNYWRVSHEFMLLGVRGGLTFADKGLKSWVSADRTGHSIKPQIVRSFVMRASPGPYLELYGREKPMDGWTVYGNEVRESLV